MIGKRNTDFIRKAQTLCKMFRSEICDMTLQDMATTLDLNIKNLSAWENGRSNKAEYIFYYYDILPTDIEREYFINAVFNSNGKEVIIDTSKNADGSVRTYSIRIE